MRTVSNISEVKNLFIALEIMNSVSYSQGVKVRQIVPVYFEVVLRSSGSLRLLGTIIGAVG